MELRQLILNYCDPDKEPEGIMGPTLLIVGGVHCRLDNIDAAGCWAEDEFFHVNGKEVKHLKGASAGNTMQAWRRLRDSRPDLFRNVQVMQQPAAVIDSVLMKWVLEDQGKRYPCSLWQRDLSGGGGFSLQSQQCMQLIGQVPTWIAGKMTSVLQLTDTDFAFRMKAFAKESKEILLDEMKAKARKAGCAVTLKAGPYELLRIVQECLCKMEAITKKEDLVLAAARRNGLLAWRPDLNSGRLEPAEGQPWCSKLPKCGDSHRLRPAWVEDRMKWLDEHGVPKQPEFTKATLCKSMEDMQDFAAVAGAKDIVMKDDDTIVGPGAKVSTGTFEEAQCSFGEFAEFDGEAGEFGTGMMKAQYLQVSPSERLLNMVLDEELAPQVQPMDSEAKKKQLQAKIMKARLRGKFLQGWRGKARKKMSEDMQSRLQQLKDLAPVVGKATTTAKDRCH